MIKFNCKNITNIKKLISLKSILSLLLIALFLLLMYHCPFSYIIGISCPGCGMTRALFSVLLFDFTSAFYYHPLWWLIIILAIGAMMDYLEILVIAPKLKNVLCALAAVALFAVYFSRLFSGSDIVSVHLEEGLLYSIFN